MSGKAKKSAQTTTPLEDKETRALLAHLAVLLYEQSKGKAMEPHEADAYSHVIREILGLGVVPRAEQVELRECDIALEYAIRKELAGRGKSKIARGETADANATTGEVVSTYSSRHRDFVQQALRRLTADSPSPGVERTAKLRKGLDRLLMDCHLEGSRKDTKSRVSDFHEMWLRDIARISALELARKELLEADPG